jgi:hypothetical protein
VRESPTGSEGRKTLAHEHPRTSEIRGSTPVAEGREPFLDLGRNLQGRAFRRRVAGGSIEVGAGSAGELRHALRVIDGDVSGHSGIRGEVVELDAVRVVEDEGVSGLPVQPPGSGEAAAEARATASSWGVVGRP